MIEVSGEQHNRTLQHPLNPNAYMLAGHAPHSETAGIAAGGQLILQKVRHEGSAILVSPLGGRYDVQAAHEGDFSLGFIEAKTLESSHAHSAQETPRHPRYYEYSAIDTLEMGLSGLTQVTVTGDFQVYVWGLDLFLSSGTESRTIRTGHTANSNAPWTSQEDFTYAIVTVHDGTLTYQSDRDGTTALYANAFEAEAIGSVEFQDAQGTVPARDGEYLVTGTAAVEGGTYEWSRSESGVGVRFLDSGNVVQGDAVSFQPAPLVERDWFLRVTLAALLSFVLVAAYLAPALAGRTGADAPHGLRNLRAAGFRRWASVADTRGRRRRAAFWAARAHRLRPHDWDVALDRAIYLAQLGRFSQALGLHEAANDGFRLGNDRDQMGHNAYQAAKTAMRSGRPVEALDWLRVAAESEPALASDMAQDPVFARLRSHPDYLSVVGPAAAW